MNEINKNKRNITILFCLGLICLVVGIAYAFIQFVFEGDREHVVDIKGISFSYEEQENGLALSKLVPMSDSEGLSSGNDYTFTVSSTSSVSQYVSYFIYLTIDEENTLNNSYVRINITNTTTNTSYGPIDISELEQKSTNEYYLIGEAFTFDGNTKTKENTYKLTIWVNEDYIDSLSYSSINNEQTTTIGGEVFNFKINVATGKLVTEMITGSEFNELIPDTATKVVFTDILPTSNTELIDVSASQNQSTMAWLDDETFYVSSMESGYTILANKNSSSMFANKSNLTLIDFSMLDTSNVTTMRNMFYNCSSLTTLNLSNFNTSNVTDMHYMFGNCSNLTTLDVSNFDISKVTDASYMFYYCSNLSLDLSDWEFSSKTDFSDFNSESPGVIISSWLAPIDPPDV